jgi:hypothetical protein
MDKLIIKSKLDDKYYIKYKNLFNYSSVKFNLINTYLLFNFVFFDNNKLCNYLFDKFDYNEYYSNIFAFKSTFMSEKKIKFNTYYENYIIDKFINNNNTSLLIVNTGFIEKNYTLLKLKKNIDIIEILPEDLPDKSKNINPNISINPNINHNLFNKYYGSAYNNIYKEFLINLKNNEKLDTIPTTNYKFISCNFGYMNCLSLSASYKMALLIPHLISTIAMSLKLIETNGTLLLFWSIVNINIPIIKKLLSILSYGFKTVEIIDNDMNQNLLIGVPEYYIKCSGYKDNISHELINKLIDIAIETIDNIYSVYDILDYYEDYTEKNPNHSLFYNKNEEKFKNYNIKKTKKTSQNSQTSSKTKTSNTRKSLTRKSNHKDKKSITPIYYI